MKIVDKAIYKLIDALLGGQRLEKLACAIVGGDED